MEVGAEPQNEATLVLASPQNRHLQQRLPCISVAAQLPQSHTRCPSLLRHVMSPVDSPLRNVTDAAREESP